MNESKGGSVAPVGDAEVAEALAYLREEGAPQCELDIADLIERLARERDAALARDRENDNLVASLDAEIKSLYRERDEARADAARLREEIRYLRQYGNKDCTAMADAARERNELEIAGDREKT